MDLKFKNDKRFLSIKKQNVKDAIEFILSKEYGETILYSDLARILEYNLNDEKQKLKFKTTISKVKNFTIDFGYILRSVQGVGYYILKPKHIGSYCYRTYIVKSQNMLDKGRKILEHTEVEGLSEQRKQEYDNVVELHSQLIDRMSTAIVNSKYIEHKKDYDNLNDE